MGNSSMPMSKSLMEPSPVATRTWFSCVSDQARSKRESCVSNLEMGSAKVWQRGMGYAEAYYYHFSAMMPLGVSPRM